MASVIRPLHVLPTRLQSLLVDFGFQGKLVGSLKVSVDDRLSDSSAVGIFSLPSTVLLKLERGFRTHLEATVA